ncbi:hypothetical protein [Mycobacterium sp. NPDC050853]|uniref:hypothetical protein n=1 Tax=Mycobacterium sp. NPDC050853 TaxID=3155160 RepID=UPI0033C01307
MVSVLIQPSFGDAAAQKHWAATLDQEVDFRIPERVHPLVADELATLEAVHPTGKARFWGAVGSNDKMFDKLKPGDIVLFTGKLHIRAIGEVGASFRNEPFSLTLWDPHPERGAWRNVYSLFSFQETEIPYEILQTALGTSPKDNFQRTRFIADHRADIVLAALQIDAQARVTEDVEDAQAALDALGKNESRRPVERALTPMTTYSRSARDVIVRRAESELVNAYKDQLPAGHNATRRLVRSGVVDIDVKSPECNEIIEAKSSSRHHKVREALGQILDYAHSVVEPVNRVATLFPTKPAIEDVALLHHYGIDIIYRNTLGAFERSDAPVDRYVVWVGNGYASEAHIELP